MNCTPYPQREKMSIPEYYHGGKPFKYKRFVKCNEEDDPCWSVSEHVETMRYYDLSINRRYESKEEFLRNFHATAKKFGKKIASITYNKRHMLYKAIFENI